ncbi:hypothetical protein BLNAU_23101 [Blattamonas nauphoetae]|uniref:Uncharacterized protein n=1 Tax=Blattamonas nauphoetae TaxID=2049346 RepID=A0ABQ9WR41_9EUKA|nr:hypothetical protein BLNAU_23101 [Blattamonas nauphoetae]
MHSQQELMENTRLPPLFSDDVMSYPLNPHVKALENRNKQEQHQGKVNDVQNPLVDFGRVVVAFSDQQKDFSPFLSRNEHSTVRLQAQRHMVVHRNNQTISHSMKNMLRLATTSLPNEIFLVLSHCLPHTPTNNSQKPHINQNQSQDRDTRKKTSPTSPNHLSTNQILPLPDFPLVNLDNPPLLAQHPRNRVTRLGCPPTLTKSPLNHTFRQGQARPRPVEHDHRRLHARRANRQFLAFERLVRGETEAEQLTAGEKGKGKEPHADLTGFSQPTLSSDADAHVTTRQFTGAPTTSEEHRLSPNELDTDAEPQIGVDKQKDGCVDSSLKQEREHLVDSSASSASNVDLL